jgi:hypothetical protein
MAINYFFARMGLFGGAVVNYRRDGQACGPEGRENSQRHQSRRSANRGCARLRDRVQPSTHIRWRCSRVRQFCLHSIRRFGPPPAMAANVTSVFGRLVISWTCLRLGRPIMPRKLCPRCHGQRTTSCLECHGTGKKAVVNIPTGNCEECGGTGRRLCDVCGGAGEVEL